MFFNLECGAAGIAEGRYGAGVTLSSFYKTADFELALCGTGTAPSSSRRQRTAARRRAEAWRSPSINSAAILGSRIVGLVRSAEHDSALMAPKLHSKARVLAENASVDAVAKVRAVAAQIGWLETCIPVVAARAVTDVELLLSARVSEETIHHQLRVFEAYELGLLATWETPGAIICVPRTPAVDATKPDDERRVDGLSRAGSSLSRNADRYHFCSAVAVAGVFLMRTLPSGATGFPCGSCRVTCTCCGTSAG